jgi:transcriptional regulatory protein GAL4
VEARLEKAEALIRKLRRENAHAAAPGQETAAATPSLASTGRAEADPPFPDIDGHPGSSTEPELPQDEPSTEEPRPPMTKPVNAGLVAHSSPTRTRGQQFLAAQATASTESNAGQGLVETPPREDFEWDELDVVQLVTSPSSAAVDAGEVQIKDGMASLAVDEKDGGYLGVASGAALLRILEPSTRTRTFSNSSSHPRVHMPLALQPDPNRHIVDTMIDAYFATYHLSYPIIHEPTFRAQYSEVIPQPHGRSWPVLAYIVAAIGVFGSSNTTTDLEFQLFAHARSMLSFDFIEMGNSTLVQALTLISNYQQKRDKPNSGYNYLGLAVRMATGLGYHKEFPGWKISPLKMELRRRIWWALCVFDVGATITFSRPILWPYEGVEVAFPTNVTDRVS